MVIVEKSFPRGGATAKESIETKGSKENIIFGAVQKKIKKTKAKIKSTDEKIDNDIAPVAFCAELLNYETIQEEMTIMGMVKAVDQLYLTVILPGGICARTSVLEISNAYTKVTKQFLDDPNKVEHYKPLTDLYKVGQIAYGKVQNIQHHGTKKRPHINLTFKPENVHSELSHIGIKKGFIFNGAVEEIQEHGIIIESGIKGLRAFVPLEKCSTEHTVGELIYLKVIKVTQDKTASTCICKELKINKLNVKDMSDPNIEYILPTTIVQFEVTKLLKDGVQGTLMNGIYTGYVNEHQLTEPLALPEDFEVNQTLPARILYVMPLTKLVYLSLNVQAASVANDDTKSEDQNENAIQTQELKRGDIVQNAKVDHTGTGGVILVLKNKFKGIISYNSIKANYKGNYDQDTVLSKYAKKSKHTVRILDYNLMDSMYICSDDKKIVDEKLFDLNDVQPGEFVNATVVARYDKVGGYSMKVGKFKAILEKLFLAPTTKQIDANTNIRCRIIGVNTERRIIYLTNRPEYMAKNCKVISSLNEAKSNGVYTGTIVHCGPRDGYLLVRFFNDVKGVLNKSQLNNSLTAEVEKFRVGKTMPFRVVQRRSNQLILTLPDDSLNIGEICPVTITNTLESGLEIKFTYDTSNSEDNEADPDAIEANELNGLIPIRFLSDFVDLLHAKLRMYSTLQNIDAVCMMRNLFSVRDVPYFRENITKDWNTINVGDVLKAYVKNLEDDIVELWLPIRGYNKLVRVHLKMLLLNAYKNAQITLTPDQVIYVKVIGKSSATKTLSVTAKLSDVWNGDLSSASDLVEQYLDEVADIKAAFKKQTKPIAKYAIGQKVTATFQGKHPETGDWCYEVTKTKTPLIVSAATVGKAKTLEVGDEQECIILWIDYSNDSLLASNNPSDLTHFTASSELSKNLAGKSGLNAKVLLKLDNIFICSLKKGQNPLVYCPIRVHCNDFEKSASISINEGEFCRLTFIHKTRPIALLESSWDLWREAKHKRKAQDELENLSKAKKSKEAHNVETNVTKSTKTKKERKESGVSKEENNKNALEKRQQTQLFYEDKGSDIKLAAAALHGTHKETSTRSGIKRLSGINDFWSTDFTQLAKNNDHNESSDDETEEEDNNNSESDTDGNPKKKKRLTAVEKFKLQRDEEERLRTIEAKYADPNQLPESIDQFDRLVMSEPNNSKHWVNYMVFHLQSTEIEKARAVARRAIKTISVRNPDDLLNMWIALLNLELRYGNKDSYDEALKEALTYNDPLRVYLRLVEVLSDANRQQELIELVGNLTKKFKSEKEMWKVAANALFRIGMTEKAQQLLHKALTCVPNREHVEIIVAFANLNHKYGHQEMGQTLLDQVVTSYPKRVDVWTQYVDMLVKTNLIDSARNVLERAIIQKIPMKKMRTIFKKYLEFEERHGDETSVQKVKALATEYVKKNS